MEPVINDLNEPSDEDQLKAVGPHAAPAVPAAAAAHAVCPGLAPAPQKRSVLCQKFSSTAAAGTCRSY